MEQKDPKMGIPGVRVRSAFFKAVEHGSEGLAGSAAGKVVSQAGFHLRVSSPWQHVRSREQSPPLLPDWGRGCGAEGRLSPPCPPTELNSHCPRRHRDPVRTWEPLFFPQCRVCWRRRHNQAAPGAWDCSPHLPTQNPLLSLGETAHHCSTAQHCLET